MSCDITKFTISKGSDNTFIFTIKQDNSTLPLEIVEETDTFFADLIALEDDNTDSNLINKIITVEDALNGKVSLDISEEETNSLATDKGSKVDRYYLRPTYKLTLKCNTTNNGNFIARIPEVYVD